MSGAISDWSWNMRWRETWWTIGRALADASIGKDSHERRLAKTVDRSGWMRGEWDDEPEDRIEWRRDGVQCLMLRSDRGSWCGYIGVDRSHPWYGRDYSDLDASVHGGLTYSGLCHEMICVDPHEGEEPHAWFVGFDCGHAWDVSPRDAYTYGYDSMYRDAAYVRNEVEQLAAQAASARSSRVAEDLPSLSAKDTKEKT